MRTVKILKGAVVAGPRKIKFMQTASVVFSLALSLIACRTSHDSAPPTESDELNGNAAALRTLELIAMDLAPLAEAAPPRSGAQASNPVSIVRSVRLARRLRRSSCVREQ
jgi:hypothetical protein